MIPRRNFYFCFIGSLLIFAFSLSFAMESAQNWTHYVRTAGHGLNSRDVDRILLDAKETNLFGIEVDNDPPGRYESFLDPKEKLEALTLMAQEAHAAGNYVFAYIAGLECITANADKTTHSFFKEHPDWVQRDLTGRPAVFGGGSAFWVRKGDEDVWISPYAKEWRQRYMEQVRQIAGTGIDGVYVDIPYWMTHFEGWENTWASFDQYTVETFRLKTGLDAKKDFKLGDFSDANFRRWVDFRIRTLTEFMKEVNENVKKANPRCKAIAEIYPGIDFESVRVGADVYELYPVLDVIAHEFGGSEGNAAQKQPAEWFSYMIGMYSFRAFAEGKASWMLSYSWDKDERVDRTEAMKNLFVAQLMAGTNSWDAQGHVMSGSNHLPTRKVVYDWIARHEKSLYTPRLPMAPVGLYFSPKTRNYFAESFIRSYEGIFNLLLQSHQEFQVVTPRTLARFKGRLLILPDTRCLADSEIVALQNFLKTGVHLFLTGEAGKYDETGVTRAESFVEMLTGKATQTVGGAIVQTRQWVYDPVCPGKAYLEAMNKYFNPAALSGNLQDTPLSDQLKQFKDTLNQCGYRSSLAVAASAFCATQIARVDGKPHLFLVNFKGLRGKENPVQKAETGVKVTLADPKISKAWFLDFLGETKSLTLQKSNGQVVVTLPDIQKGAIVWFEK